MKLPLATLIYVCLSALTLPLSRAALSDQALSLTCVPSGSNSRLAVDSPIWLDLVLTNDGTSRFSGYVETTPDLGVSIAAAKSSQPLLQAMPRPFYLDILSVGLKLDPGQSQTFRILFNEFYTVLRPGVVSGQVSLPLQSRFDNKTFSVQASFSLNIGSALSLRELASVAAEIRNRLNDTRVTSADPNARLEAIRAARPLPNKIALPLLRQAIHDSDTSVQYCGLLVLRDRPPTREILDLVREALKSDDDAVKSTAEQILAKH